MSSRIPNELERLIERRMRRFYAALDEAAAWAVELTDPAMVGRLEWVEIRDDATGELLGGPSIACSLRT